LWRCLIDDDLLLLLLPQAVLYDVEDIVVMSEDDNKSDPVNPSDPEGRTRNKKVTREVEIETNPEGTGVRREEETVQEHQAQH
jgi:hypothetical protein